MKTENVKFLTSPPQVVLQDTKKSFEGAHWDAKNNWNSHASLWNSTIVTTLIHRYSYNFTRLREIYTNAVFVLSIFDTREYAILVTIRTCDNMLSLACFVGQFLENFVRKASSHRSSNFMVRIMHISISMIPLSVKKVVDDLCNENKFFQ